MADLRYAGMAVYAMVFYSLLQISVAPKGDNRIGPQSDDLHKKNIQMDADELILKSNPRRLRATEGAEQEMRAKDRMKILTGDVGLHLLTDIADDSVGEEKAGSEFRTDSRTEGELSSAGRERDPKTGIQSRYDARSKQRRRVIGNQAKYAGDSSSSIACASGFKNNCQRTRSQVNKTGGNHEDGVRNPNMRGESVAGEATRASVGLGGKMNVLKSGTSRFNDSPSLSRLAKSNSRTQTQRRYNLNDTYSHKEVGNNRKTFSEDIRHDSGNTMHVKYQLFRDGIFWSESVEKLLPNRTSETVVSAWRYEVQSQRVLWLLSGCGRDSNRLAVLENGERLCCRYRQNVDQIQGEILSFHLSRLMGLDNLPLGILMKIEPDSEQWEAVKENITAAGWKEGKVIVATKWIPDLQPAYMPTELKGVNSTLHSQLWDKFDLINLKKKPDHLVELVQWSDLAIFDYITVNLDRIVNTLVNLQWNRYMLKQPVHNLEVSKTDKRLWFLDNESGLRHGYRMLDQYGHYHDQILKSVCVFRAQTVQRLKVLGEKQNFWELFISAVESEEPLLENLPSYPPQFRDVLKDRIINVVKHAEHCKEKHRDTSL